ncbi:MAG: hypothetical protein WC346_22380 [Methanogenium sp.]|jgi:murein endopeptidase
MIEGKCVCFFRGDLIGRFKNIPFEEVDYQHLKISKNNPFLKNNLVMFVDDDGNQKIIKNRFGMTGVIVSSSLIKHIKRGKLLEELINLFIWDAK